MGKKEEGEEGPHEHHENKEKAQSWPFSLAKKKQGGVRSAHLSVHENAGEIQLHLEAHVHVGAVDGGGPPQSETAVGDLIQTRALGVGQLLVPEKQRGRTGRGLVSDH